MVPMIRARSTPMMNILKLIAASAAPLLAAGCVAYPYYDEPYDSGHYGGGGYGYSAPPAVAYAPPAVSFQYYDYDAHPRAYREYHEDRYYRRDYHGDSGRSWHGDHRDDRRPRTDRDHRDHHDHRYYDGH